MDFSPLSLVICVLVTTAFAGVWSRCWLAARRLRRQHGDWARLAPWLRELDEELDRMWAVEKERARRHP